MYGISPISVSYRTPVKFSPTNQPALLQPAGCTSIPRFGADSANVKKIFLRSVAGVATALIAIGLVVDDPNKITVKVADINDNRISDVEIKFPDANGDGAPEKIAVIPIDIDGERIFGVSSPDKVNIDMDFPVDTTGDKIPDKMIVKLPDNDGDGKQEKILVELADTNRDGQAEIVGARQVASTYTPSPAPTAEYYGFGDT